MKTNNGSDRRNFLKTAGAALVAASVPVAIAAQKDEARPGAGNNMKQMIIFGGVSEPLPNLPGTFGQACFTFQMRFDFGRGGTATLTDPCFTDLNSHIEIHSGGRTDINDIYVFRGTVKRSGHADLMGKAIVIKVQVIGTDGNCDVWLTIEGSVIAALLLPAIQKIRD